MTSSGTPVGADSILRYDGLSGIFQDVFHSARALGELSYLTTAPGGHLHVSGSDTFFDGAFDQHVVAEKLSVPTASIDVPFLDPNSPLSPGVGQGIDLGPAGHFYLYDSQNDEVRRFDDLTGADLGVFVPSPNDVRDQEFGPNGNLFVLRSSEVMEYNGVNGLGIGIFTSGGLFANARGITFGPDSDLYISAEDFVTGTPTIYRYDGLTGVLDGIVATHPDFQGLGDLVFGSDGQLYVSDGDILGIAGDAVYQVDPSGSVVPQLFVLRGSGGLSDPLGITFGPSRISAQSGVAREVHPGTYVAGEEDSFGYTLTFSGDCSPDGNITVAAGESKTCILINDDTPPEIVSLQLDTQPGDGIAALPLSVQPVLSIRDGLGNLIASDNTSQVLASIDQGPPGATLSGTTTVTAVNGVVTFPDLSLDVPGTYQLVFQLLGANPFFLQSAAFEVLPAGLQLDTEPGDGTAALPLSVQPVLSIRDGLGNLIAADNTSQVLASIDQGPPGTTLSGVATVTAANGIVTFLDLSLDVPGTYQLLFQVLGPNPVFVQSAPFEVLETQNTFCDDLTIDQLIAGGSYNVIDNRDGHLDGITIQGTIGADLILLSDAGNRVRAGLGADCIVGGQDNDDIRAGQGDDQVFGRGGNDKIRGEKGADRIEAGEGDDRVWGGQGKDTIDGGSGVDAVRGGNEADSIDGGPGDDDLRGGRGTDEINGSSGDDDIRGDQGADTLSGDQGDDLILGNLGADNIDGGDDTDICDGGKGANVIVNCELAGKRR